MATRPSFAAAAQVSGDVVCVQWGLLGRGGGTPLCGCVAGGMTPHSSGRRHMQIGNGRVAAVMLLLECVTQ